MSSRTILSSLTSYLSYSTLLCFSSISSSNCLVIFAKLAYALLCLTCFLLSLYAISLRFSIVLFDVKVSVIFWVAILIKSLVELLDISYFFSALALFSLSSCFFLLSILICLATFASRLVKTYRMLSLISFLTSRSSITVELISIDLMRFYTFLSGNGLILSIF